MTIRKPVNAVQLKFNELCAHGGGQRGGPPKSKVQELLHWGSVKLNGMATREAEEHLTVFADRNPWHVCFALGLCWGHLARLEFGFTERHLDFLSFPRLRGVACVVNRLGGHLLVCSGSRRALWLGLSCSVMGASRPDVVAGPCDLHAGHGFRRRNWTRRRML